MKGDLNKWIKSSGFDYIDKIEGIKTRGSTQGNQIRWINTRGSNQIDLIKTSGSNQVDQICWLNLTDQIKWNQSIGAN